MTGARAALEREWFTLTREAMPAAAVLHGWPVRLDHCFQRILLDHTVGGAWRDHIAPPAYRNATDAELAYAVELGNAALSGEADLAALNHQSLIWRGKV